MAKATLLPVVPVKRSVQLELSPEEAQTLADITGKIGGSPEHSRRKYTDAIYQALDAVGYKSNIGEQDCISFRGTAFRDREDM